jgi:cytochrome c
MKYLTTLAAMLMLGGTAHAADPANGEKIFAQRCATCHMIVAPSGKTIVKGGKTGPNQYGVVGRQAGTAPDFERYGDDLVAAGEAGLVWTEAEIAAYVEDPRAYLRARLSDNGAKSRMAFKLNGEAERADVAAYLASVE